MTKQDINDKNQKQDQIEAEVLEATEVAGDSRTPRETSGSNQRADTQRTQAWQPPSVLPDPKPQDGWVFRWIRTATVESIDNNYLRESDPRMPMLEPQRNSRTTFGKH